MDGLQLNKISVISKTLRRPNSEIEKVANSIHLESLVNSKSDCPMETKCRIQKIRATFTKLALVLKSHQNQDKTRLMLCFSANLKNWSVQKNSKNFWVSKKF